MQQLKGDDDARCRTYVDAGPVSGQDEDEGEQQDERGEHEADLEHVDTDGVVARRVERRCATMPEAREVAAPPVGVVVRPGPTHAADSWARYP